MIPLSLFRDRSPTLSFAPDQHLGTPTAAAEYAVGDASVTAQLFLRHLATPPTYGGHALGELVKVVKP